jgi:hypothetical protein
MDQLLLPYLQASDESERERHLDELLVVYATPVVRRILSLKLGFQRKGGQMPRGRSFSPCMVLLRQAPN